ncbi:MAG: guanylate kinase [Acinetobacter sp.]|uniref:guanylate kinase n=1 Tax=Acinetobacter sp. TaxID=472 RepID=UPI000FAC5084|nr:guanylate kinase [Acinetobacter sp.]RUP42019.1 MAG: guanylate kinase [Acinetobacter sp.]
MIIILSAPSGCGKTSIAKRIISSDPNIILSVSATTRKPRPAEIEGINYFFKTIAEFKKMDLLESTKIYGNLYGTPRQFVEDQIKKGKDILFDIESNGAYQIMDKAHVKVVSIFILPPSLEILRTRLLNRNQDSETDIELRLKEAEGEQNHAKNYHYTVINDDFDQAVKKVQEIIALERLRGKINDQK